MRSTVAIPPPTKQRRRGIFERRREQSDAVPASEFVPKHGETQFFTSQVKRMMTVYKDKEVSSCNTGEKMTQYLNSLGVSEGESTLWGAFHSAGVQTSLPPQTAPFTDSALDQYLESKGRHTKNMSKLDKNNAFWDLWYQTESRVQAEETIKKVDQKIKEGPDASFSVAEKAPTQSQAETQQSASAAEE